MLSDEELLNLAGERALARGRAYHVEGRVALTVVDAAGFSGEADGQETYGLQLQRAGNGWRWQCNCPAAAGGAFCKHLVAAVLTAREAATADGRPAKPGKRAAHDQDELASWLRAQDSARLAGWLLSLAGQDPQVSARLELFRAGEDPAALKVALGRMLTVGGFLDYRRTNAFASRLGTVVDALAAFVEHDPAAAVPLCEYAVRRLLKVYTRCDDSAGSLGDRVGQIASLHARACQATMPGKTLVKSLLALQQQDEWELFPVADYWDALGAEGRRRYGERVMADFAALPPAPGPLQLDRDFAVQSRAEAYARTSGDVDLLLRVLGRDVARPHGLLRVIEVLRDHGRHREALTTAEDAVKRFPDDVRLRHLLAGCLADAGLDDEAVDQVWNAFGQEPTEANWDGLKRLAGHEWPRWRERALAHVAATETGDATGRILLLMHDGDVSGAAVVAGNHAVQIEVLARLAQRAEQQAPAEAGAFYLRIARQLASNPQPSWYPRLVDALQGAARCLPVGIWKPHVDQVRSVHGRKRKLIGMLDEAGL